MSRLAYSIEALAEQVSAARKDAEITYGEPDGLDVIREVSFDKATSKWLWPTLRDNPDVRVVEQSNRGGIVKVTVSPASPVADQRSVWAIPGSTEEASAESTSAAGA